MGTKFFFSIIAAGFFLSACKNKDGIKTDYVPVNIDITHMAAGAKLELDKGITNPHGEPLTITQFAYYLSNFSAITNTGTEIPLALDYFLINEKTPGSKNFFINLPEGKYASIRMLIGVDSTRNVSGVQSGALDPANGMFWTWNTGYIFAKLEGKSPVSAAPLQNVTYHIGGFKKAESALQFVTLPFPEILEVKTGGSVKVNLKADVDVWFNAVHNIKIADEAFAMNPGLLAQRISENYARMFKVDSVQD